MHSEFSMSILPPLTLLGYENEGASVEGWVRKQDRAQGAAGLWLCPDTRGSAGDYSTSHWISTCKFPQEEKPLEPRRDALSLFKEMTWAVRGIVWGWRCCEGWSGLPQRSHCPTADLQSSLSVPCLLSECTSNLGSAGCTTGYKVFPNRSSHPHHVPPSLVSLVISIPIADEDSVYPRGWVSIYCDTSRDSQAPGVKPEAWLLFTVPFSRRPLVCQGLSLCVNVLYEWIKKPVNKSYSLPHTLFFKLFAWVLSS